MTTPTTDERRTERAILAGLSEEERALLKRVLELERGRLHVHGADLTDDILAAVKEVLP